MQLRSILGAAALAVSAFCAATTTPVSAMVGGGNFGFQDNVGFTLAVNCANGEAGTFIDVTFDYLRSPNELGAIGWKATVFEKDTNSADDLVVIKTGVFPPLLEGGNILEVARPTFLFDSCPTIQADVDDDGNACAEYYVKLEITSTSGADPASVQSFTTETKNVCCDQCVSLAIDLLSFQPTFANGTVVVDWATASETDNAGFRVERSATPWGPWLAVNQGLIPATGSPTQGVAYTFVDTTPNAQMGWYRLVDVDIHGVASVHEAKLAAGWPLALRSWLLVLMRQY